MSESEFELYDLRIEWVSGERPCWCGARAGDHFLLRGERLELPPGVRWSIYTLAAILPLLPAKQRQTDPCDWMTTDEHVACPDPNCDARFRIRRVGRRRFRHAETTATELEPDRPTDPP